MHRSEKPASLLPLANPVQPVPPLGPLPQKDEPQPDSSAKIASAAGQTRHPDTGIGAPQHLPSHHFAGRMGRHGRQPPSEPAPKTRNPRSQRTVNMLLTNMSKGELAETREYIDQLLLEMHEVRHGPPGNEDKEDWCYVEEAQEAVPLGEDFEDVNPDTETK